MKKTYFLLLALLIGISACEKDNIEPTSMTNVISGEVMSIELEEEGYTAKIKSQNEELYFALVSISNLGSDEAFKDLEIGKKVTLKGVNLRFGGNHEFTVKKIISTDNDNFNLKGNVISITENELGYEAEILGSDEEIYSALFSISNLGNKFENFIVGETREVKGKLFKIDQKLHLTVKDIIK